MLLAGEVSMRCSSSSAMALCLGRGAGGEELWLTERLQYMHAIGGSRN